MAVRRGEESWKRQCYKKAMAWEWQRGAMRMFSANSDVKPAYVGGREPVQPERAAGTVGFWETECSG